MAAVAMCVRESIVIRRMDGTHVCTDTGCEISPNLVARQLHQLLKEVNQFFLENFGICGLDGRGEMVPSYIGWDRENAMWICDTNKCRFVFNSQLARNQLTVTHEFMHGIVKRFNPLPGPLNESIADVMALAFQQWKNPAAPISWEINGAGRNFKRHAHIGMFNAQSEVHAVSQVPSHAVYVAANNGRLSPLSLSQIWMRAFLESPMFPTMQQFATRTVQVAQASGLPHTAQSILSGWRDVGVL